MDKTIPADLQPELSTRRLGHLTSITEGESFGMLPSKLLKAYFDGHLPEPKFRLLAMVMTHSANFKIKHAYLRARFSPTTLKKYITEIEAQGFIIREHIPSESGGTEIVYHTREVKYWDLSALGISDESSQVNGSSVNGSSVNPLNKIKGNQNKKKKNNPMDGCKSKANAKAKTTPVPEVEPDTPEPSSETRKTSIHGIGVIELSKRLERIFKKPGEFVNYAENNEWMQSVVERHGIGGAKRFVEYCEREIPEGAYRWNTGNRAKLYASWNGPNPSK